jgi:hypothetical protein
MVGAIDGALVGDFVLVVGDVVVDGLSEGGYS